jgi:3-isopropylmalate/(R)-2-methylmalate dehydratase small subunit
MSRSDWKFESRYVVIARENIDTDQIIPARYLTTTSRNGLGPHAFHDWRYAKDGSPNPDFPLNRPEAAGARVLVAGSNFGCGSSREHAVWALLDAGFKSIVSSQFADIFRGNALNNGLLPVQVSPEILTTLMNAVGAGSISPTVHIDLEENTFSVAEDIETSFAVPPFARYCMLNGMDEMQFLVSSLPKITRYELSHPCTVDTVDATR